MSLLKNWPSHDFLAKNLEIPLERNWRDAWDDRARDDIGITLEIMEQLEIFILHTCMEKSRFMVWEMISRKWKRDFLISPKNRDGGEDLHLLLEMVMHEHSLIFFFFFFPFSSFSSPFFLSYCSSLEERERESRWEWDGSAGLAIQFMLTCGSKGRKRKTGHWNWIY